MGSSFLRRYSVLGQSFTTCLLAVVLVFGGLGAYYFKVFQWRHLEDPHYDLLIVKKDDPAQLADFRRSTVPKYVDPAIQQLNKVTKLRKASKRGTVVPEEYNQSCKEILESLRSIMNDAKLRQIPKVYEKEYKKILKGISDAYKSLVALQEGVGNEIKADRDRAIDSSIKYSNAANKNLQAGRKYFFQP